MASTRTYCSRYALVDEVGPVLLTTPAPSLRTCSVEIFGVTLVSSNFTQPDEDEDDDDDDTPRVFLLLSLVSPLLLLLLLLVCFEELADTSRAKLG